MKRLINLCIIFIILIISIIPLSSCNNVGNISIVSPNTNIDGIKFDTSRLKIIEAEVVDEIDYSIKIIGKTTPISDQAWKKFFDDDEPDIAGKLAVPIKLEYSKDIAIDKDATITLPDGVKENDTKTYKLIDIADGDVNNPYVYIILNTKHDIANITLTYQVLNKTKNIIYQIDMLNINSDSERLE